MIGQLVAESHPTIAAFPSKFLRVVVDYHARTTKVVGTPAGMSKLREGLSGSGMHLTFLRNLDGSEPRWFSEWMLSGRELQQLKAAAHAKDVCLEIDQLHAEEDRSGPA